MKANTGRASRVVTGAVLAALCLAGTAAQADEMWQSTYGPVIWETDMGETAVLLLQDETRDRTVRLFVEGLAAEVAGPRGHYRGVWIASQKSGDVGPCATAMVDPMGGTSTDWGTFQVTFVSPFFPSDWAGSFGQCLDTPLDPVSAVAQTG